MFLIISQYSFFPFHLVLQKQEANAVSARNVELTHLLVEYQKRVRESSDALNAAEDNARKLSMEVCTDYNHEKLGKFIFC